MQSCLSYYCILNNKKKALKKFGLKTWCVQKNLLVIKSYSADRV